MMRVNDSSLVTGSGDEGSLHDALADGAETVPLHQCKYIEQFLHLLALSQRVCQHTMLIGR